MAAYPGPGGLPPRRAHLYVGNLSPRVSEYMLTEIFAVAGPVQHVKIIPDRNYQHGGLNYGFVEYTDMRSAETALQTLNGRKIFETEIRVNWAYQGSGTREDTTHHFHVFVGDLSPEVNDDVLNKAFAAFGSLSDARVMWDMNSGKSRGYGFLAFRDKTDAEQAIATMNGEWLGSRAIRVNWANQKSGAGGGGGGLGGPPMGMGSMPSYMPRPPPAAGLSPIGTAPGYGSPMDYSMAATPISAGGFGLTYEQVLAQAPQENTTIYVGNLSTITTAADLQPLVQNFGRVVETRIIPDRGFAFIKLESHEAAAAAIVALQNTTFQGRMIKASWGRERAPGDAVPAPTTPSAAVPSAYGSMPMYGMPTPGQYPNYTQGYTPYMGGTPGATPGMPTPGAAGAAGGAEGTATGWDSNNYYPQYWGGYYSGQNAGQPESQQ